MLTRHSPFWPFATGVLATACIVMMLGQGAMEPPTSKDDSIDETAKQEAIDAIKSKLKELVRGQLQVRQLELVGAHGEVLVRIAPDAQDSGSIVVFDSSSKEIGRLPALVAHPEPIAALPPLPAFRNSGVYTGDIQGHYIKDNIDRGRYLMLDDGSLWEVSRVDKYTCAYWLKLSDVLIVESDNPSYPYKIISVDDEESVEAKLIKD